MKKSRALRQGGFTLVEALVALGVATIVLGIGLSVMGATGRALPVESGRVAGEMQVDQLVTQLNESAHSSVSVYTPNTPNTCGPGVGDGTACPSIRFYGLDSNHTAHFWGWDYNAATKTVTQCQSYASSEGGCNVTGGSLTGVLAFAATPLTAPVIGARYGLIGGVRNVEKKMLGSDARVVAGNRLMVVNIANSYVQRETHLLQSGAPFTASVLKGSYTPPPLSSTQLTANPNPMWFANAAAAAQTATANETNYAAYEPYIPQASWWSGSSTACITASWNASTQPSDSTTFSVRPTGTAIGSCPFTISSHDQPSNQLPAYVSGPLTAFWNGTPQGNNANVSLSYGQAATLGGGKTWDANENGNLGAITLGACLELGVLGPNNTWGASPTAAYGIKGENVTATAVGACAMSIADTVGDAPQTLNISVSGTLSASPSNIALYVPGGSLSPTSATIALAEPGYSGPFVVASSTCGGSVSMSGFSSGGPNARLIVNAVSPTSCVITFGDQYNARASVVVTVGPNATPTPTTTVALTNLFLNRFIVTCRFPNETECYGHYQQGGLVTDEQADSTTFDQAIDIGGYVLTVIGNQSKWIDLHRTGTFQYGAFFGAMGPIPGGSSGGYTDLPNMSIYTIARQADLTTMNNNMTADGNICQIDDTWTGTSPLGMAWANGEQMYCKSRVADPVHPFTSGSDSVFMTYFYTAVWSQSATVYAPAPFAPLYYHASTIAASGSFTDDYYYDVPPGTYYFMTMGGDISMAPDAYSCGTYGASMNSADWFGSYGGSWTPCADSVGYTIGANQQLGVTSQTPLSVIPVSGAPITPTPAPTPTKCVGGKSVCNPSTPPPKSGQIVAPVPRPTP